jgi:hypothetical protein
MEVSMAVEIIRKDRTASELRAVAAKCKDAKAARQMFSIAMVLEGYDRKTAAEMCGMDRQTLRGEEDTETVRGQFPRRTDIAITPRGWRVCQTGDGEVGRPG